MTDAVMTPAIHPAADRIRYFRKYSLRISRFEIPTALSRPISFLSFSSCVRMMYLMQMIEMNSMTVLTSRITRIIMPSESAFIILIRG